MNRTLLAMTALSIGIATPALAEYPENPITFILPTGAGGSTDVGIRTWIPYMEQCLGNNASITVDYRPGASHQIGLAELAVSEPDGYTLGSINMPNAVVGPIADDVPYDVDSFDYLGSFYGNYMSLNVRSDAETQSLTELVEKARTDNAPLTIGIGSVGGDDHLIGLRFGRAAGIDVRFIPFGSAAQGRTALLGGHADVGSMSVAEAVTFQDELTTLAVAAEEELGIMPGVPTFRSMGFEVVGGSRHIIGGPRGLPEDVKEKWSSCIDQVGSNQEFVAEAEQVLQVAPLDAAASEEYVRSEAEGLVEVWQTTPWK